MDLSAKKLAVGAVRLATMSCFGPLAGGLFVAGGAVAAKILAESGWVGTVADMLMHLASDKASNLFGMAVEGVSKGHRADFEKPMKQAALKAVDSLKAEAPAGFGDWFEAWHDYLMIKPAAEVFAGARDLDPHAVEYDDGQFRDLWWNRMEPVLIGWHNAERLSITQELPLELGKYLRARLPQAMQEAHEEVLRDPQMSRSWIAFQQQVYGDIRNQLDRIEAKLDRLQAGAPAAPAAPVWTIPIPTQHFQDRPDLIGRIDQALAQGATALTALHGLGGIGKTQLARGFARQRRDRYKLGAWIEAETTESLLTSLSALAPLLGVPVEQDQQAMVARVLNELSAREPWLVIFDNAVSAETLRPYVEKLGGNGHVLITSRSEHWDGLATTVSVTQWSVEESARFLLERTEQQDQAAAEALARDLDGLVLALEHAAAYMLAGDEMPLARYREIWREKLKWIAKGHAYPDSVAAALGLSLEAVATESPAAYDLLCLFAWLAPDRVPKKELLEAGAKKLPEALKTALADHDQWTEVIETLGKYSLLKRERTDGVITGYAMHRVIQEIVRHRLGSDEARARWFAAACVVVDAAFPFDSDEPEFWPMSEALLPHARAIREHVRLVASPASLGRLLNQAGLYLRLRGLYAEARDFQELALESGLQQFGPDHPSVAACRSNLANILGDLGEHAEARKQIELALESDLRQLGPDHPNVAIRRSNLANILGDLGEHAEARKQIELALESDLRQFGPDHPNVATRRSNLANILGDLGEHAEARKQIELALDSDLRQRGPDHPNVAVSRWNLAAILYDLGEYNAALREIEQALEIFRKTLPPEHPHIRNAERWRKIILDAIGAAGA